ncbi:MAG: polysaccharide pyruvyl transferase family protein [Oscillospiraceae bacterium]|nr:polysaccharide pyruvyl transferase family protein [Oscillospiraceae bacterium]
MKIGILTLYYHNYNYGGQLQAFALCEYLNSLCRVQCEQIAYDYKSEMPNQKSPKKIIFRLYSVFAHPKTYIELSKRKNLFRNFEDSIPHSGVVCSPGLPAVAEKYDYIFAGSDQIWNFDYAPKDFLLGAVDKKKRCAYAASFGKSNVDFENNTDVIQILSSYSFLTVRENSAKKMLTKKGLSNVEEVCDPTLLLDRKFWEKKILPINSLKKGNYMFVYLLCGNEKTRKVIKEKAHQHNVSIVFIPHIHFSYQKKDVGFSDVDMYRVGPLEFLRLIYDAEIVVSDSFHCSLFSMMFEKNFWVIQENAVGQASTSGRMQSLISKASLTDRLVSSASEIDLSASISYSDISSKIPEFIDYSKKVLGDFLEL